MSEGKSTRRQFIKNIGVTCACSDLLITAIASGTDFANYAQRENPKTFPDIEYRTLGRTGLKVSALSDAYYASIKIIFASIAAVVIFSANGVLMSHLFIAP